MVTNGSTHKSNMPLSHESRKARFQWSLTTVLNPHPNISEYALTNALKTLESCTKWYLAHPEEQKFSPTFQKLKAKVNSSMDPQAVQNLQSVVSSQLADVNDILQSLKTP